MLHRFDFPRDKQAPAAARRAVDTLPLPEGSEAITNARLLISELVTNSVQHGAGDKVTVLIDAEDPGVLRCEVIDDGSGFVPRGREGREIGGWGLDLVERMTQSWGVREGSTHVWFEMTTGAGAPQR
jgi:anti-sigma regulatory factor (Ser/Thr protein kinase)